MRFAVVLVLVLVAARAAAQASRALPLREAIAEAVRGNPTLAMSVADWSAALGARDAAAGLDDPIVDGAATWSEAQTPLGRASDLELSVGVTQPLPTGGSVGLHLVTGRTAPAGMPSAWAPSLQLSLTHSLLRGVGVGVARAPQRRAAIGVAAADGARLGAAASLVRDVVDAYWELYFAGRQLEVLRQATLQARAQLRIVEANIAVGKQPASASAEVEVVIAQRDTDAALAEEALVDRAVELARLVGLELDGAATTLRAADAPADAARVPALDVVLGEALRGNYDLLVARAEVKLARVDVDVARNARLPQLDVSLAGGPTGSSPAAATAFAQLGAFGGWSVQAGAIFSEAIPNRAARGALTTAVAARAKSEASETAVRQLVQANVIRAVAAVKSAADRLAALAPSTAAADRDLAAERARFDLGRGTNFDVLRRQDEVAQVQLRLARARVDYEEALAAVGALTGAILPRFGVTLR